MLRLRAFYLLMGMLTIILMAYTAAADDSPSCRFSGTVHTEGSEVAGGTLITAVIEGDEFHTHTPTGYGYSTYSITIKPPQGKNYPDGAEIRFEINGHPADQTSTFTSWGNFELNLSAAYAGISDQINTGSTSPYAGPSNEGGSFNWAVIIGLLTAMAVTGAITYYVILIRRVIRKNFLNEKGYK